MVGYPPNGLDLGAVFQTLAHPIQPATLEQQAEGPENVGELAESCNVSLAAVSKHPQILMIVGLLDFENEGHVRRCYSAAVPLSAAFGGLIWYRIFWDDRFEVLSDHLGTKTNDRYHNT